MSERELGHGRGWQRLGFNTLHSVRVRAHSGTGDIDFAVAFDRGLDEPFCAFCVAYPADVDAPQIGLHMHRGEPAGKDIEEWYIILEGTGIQRFTNGDSVEFGPGDMIVTYPGTGRSLEVTGDEPVKLIAIAPRMFATPLGSHDQWPSAWEPRIKVLTMNDDQNPLTAQCSDCGATWERPDYDAGSNTLPIWAVDHQCTKQVKPTHLRAEGPSEAIS
jgi:hypothetical protein